MTRQEYSPTIVIILEIIGKSTECIWNYHHAKAYHFVFYCFRIDNNNLVGLNFNQKEKRQRNVINYTIIAEIWNGLHLVKHLQ